LRGKAKDNSGRITWDGLQGYVRDQVPLDVPKYIGGGAKQEPHLMSSLRGRQPVLIDPGKSDKEEIVKSQPKEINNSIGMKLVLIPKGKFLMGSPKGEKGRSEEEQQHPVEITKDFYLGVHEVTQGQYKEVMGKNPSYFCAEGDGKDKVKGLNTDDF